MLKKIPIGTRSFSKLKNDGYYFVDKTLLIKEFLDKGREVTLVTRPRRFGKTINMSMLAEFFDITKDSHKLFEGTKIMDTPYANEMNQYSTIFISFIDAKSSKQQIVQFIKNQIQNEYERFDHIFKKMTPLEKNDYDLIIKGIMNKYNETLTDVNYAIAFLMKMLKKYYGKKVMVFIDEYDTPFIEAKVGGFYEEIKDDLVALLRTALKSSDDLQYAYLTGIQRVAKENVFSDLNNVKVFTVANQEYAEYFGFTTDETKELLKYYGLELTDEVKDMYDGYRIGKQDIYNPWSIMNYADSQVLDSYWVNTSEIVMIRNALEEVIQNDSTFKEEYDEFIINGSKEATVFLETSFYEAASPETLWGLFINAGYLTIDEDLGDDEYVIRIPNKEVRKDFIKLTESYLSLNKGQLNNIIKYLVSEKKDSFLRQYQNILMLPSYYDLKNENSYHMMMLGMSVCLCDDYEIKSNREEGKGRCDLILKAKNTNQTSFVLEFKYLKENQNVTDKLEELSSQAIQQIKENKYDSELTGKVVYIGLAHHEKDVVMKWEEK